jgi:hypothetical protein
MTENIDELWKRIEELGFEQSQFEVQRFALTAKALPANGARVDCIHLMDARAQCSIHRSYIENYATALRMMIALLETIEKK